MCDASSGLIVLHRLAVDRERAADDAARLRRGTGCAGRSCRRTGRRSRGRARAPAASRRCCGATTPCSRTRYETQFSFGESFGPTAATVCSVRFTLRPPAAAATGTRYGVGPSGQERDVDADQDPDDGDAEQRDQRLPGSRAHTRAIYRSPKPSLRIRDESVIFASSGRHASALSELSGRLRASRALARQTRAMTLTTLITLNAALGAAVVYALHHLLAHGIRSDRRRAHASSPHCRSASARAHRRLSTSDLIAALGGVLGSPADAMRILVIEDEPRILGFLKVGLEAEGFAVDGAEDGVSGLALALCRAVRARRPRPAAAAARRPAPARRAAPRAAPSCRC